MNQLERQRRSMTFNHQSLVNDVPSRQLSSQCGERDSLVAKRYDVRQIR